MSGTPFHCLKYDVNDGKVSVTVQRYTMNVIETIARQYNTTAEKTIEQMNSMLYKAHLIGKESWAHTLPYKDITTQLMSFGYEREKLAIIGEHSNASRHKRLSLSLDLEVRYLVIKQVSLAELFLSSRLFSLILCDVVSKDPIIIRYPNLSFLMVERSELSIHIQDAPNLSDIKLLSCDSCDIFIDDPDYMPNLRFISIQGKNNTLRSSTGNFRLVLYSLSLTNVVHDPITLENPQMTGLTIHDCEGDIDLRTTVFSTICCRSSIIPNRISVMFNCILTGPDTRDLYITAIKDQCNIQLSKLGRTESLITVLNTSKYITVNAKNIKGCLLIKAVDNKENSYHRILASDVDRIDVRDLSITGRMEFRRVPTILRNERYSCKIITVEEPIDK